jgi:hypothetical protein
VTVKIEALEYDGLLFRTEKEVLKYKASKALTEAYKNSRGVYDSRFYAILDDPLKAYLILSEIYNDR